MHPFLLPRTHTNSIHQHPSKVCSIMSLYFSNASNSLLNLLGTGKTNSVLAEVVDRVVAAEESIAEDDQGTGRWGDIHALEGRNAASRDLKDVVRGWETVVGTSKVEGDVGKRALLAAVNRVLAVVALLSTDFFVQKLSKVGREDVEGSASVKNDTGVLKLGNLIAKSNGIEVNLPIGLAAKGDILNLTLVVVLVDSAKDGLALALGVGKVEGEDRLIKKALIDHLEEGGDDAVDGDAVVGEAENTIEPAKSEGQAGFFGGLGKVLILDLEIADGKDVVGDKTTQAAGAVVDLEVTAIGLVCRRSVGVVCRVKIAGNATARLGRHPEVGAASVEDDLERLGRGSDSDLGEV